MLLQSDARATVRTIGYFDLSTPQFATWLRSGLGSQWTCRDVGFASEQDMMDWLQPSRPLSRYALIPLKSWTAVLNNAALGTDVGVLPAQFARDCRRRAIRATWVEEARGVYPGRVLEVHGPEGDGPLLAVRSLAAVNDGGRWTFDSHGKPFAFEDVSVYEQRRVSDRFTGARLIEYLSELGVPCSGSDLQKVIVIERTR